jgi:hypothetical protein
LTLDALGTLSPLGSLALFPLGPVCLLETLAFNALRALRALHLLTIEALRTLGALDLLTLDALRALRFFLPAARPDGAIAVLSAALGVGRAGQRQRRDACNQ